MVAVTGIKNYTAKVYFGVLMFIGIHFLKINLWGNIAKVWAKRMVVGSRLKIENGYVSAANENFRVTELTIEVSVNQESLIEVGPTIQKPKIEFTPFEDLIARHRQISKLIHIRGRIASISNSSKQVVVKVVDDEDLDIQVIFSKDRFDPALEKDSLLSVTFGKLCHYGSELAIRIIDFSRVSSEILDFRFFDRF